MLFPHVLVAIPEHLQPIRGSSNALRRLTSHRQHSHAISPIGIRPKALRSAPRDRGTSIPLTASAIPLEENRFLFPPTAATMDEATLQRIMTAAMQAANANATAQVQSLRKPELPQFDKSNIEIWIKRVESAYARVRVTDPKLKFAHLESKFDVNSDPIINDFLFKTDATADTWTSFLGYLRECYGRTTKQAVLVINSTPREGRTPSQLVALMKEKAGGVTLDNML